MISRFFRAALVAFLYIAAFSCNDKNSDDPRIELNIETVGETSFPKEGGILLLRIKAYAVAAGAEPSQKNIVSPSLIHVGMGGNNFTILASGEEGDDLAVEIEAGENREASLVSDELIVSARFDDRTLSKTVKLSQEEAEITYKRLVSCKNGTHIAIPATGGTFEFPVISQRETYVNGRYDTREAASLAGLYLEYIEVNCAGPHRLTYRKDASAAGLYIFTYTAEGPYNLNFEWDGNSDEGLIGTESCLVIREGKTALLRIDFTQPQTPGEEYFWGMSSFYSREPIRD